MYTRRAHSGKHRSAVAPKQSYLAPFLAGNKQHEPSVLNQNANIGDKFPFNYQHPRRFQFLSFCILSFCTLSFSLSGSLEWSFKHFAEGWIFLICYWDFECWSWSFVTELQLIEIFAIKKWNFSYSCYILEYDKTFNKPISKVFSIQISRMMYPKLKRTERD